MQNGGGQISLSPSDFPVDIGQPIPGAIVSAALGLNYSIDLQDNNRLNLSYLGNGLKKILSTNSQVANYLPAGSYETQGSGNNEQKQLNNGLNIHWRKTVGSFYQVEARIFGQLAARKNSGQDIQNNFRDNVLINSLDMGSEDRNNNNKIGGWVSGILKTQGKWRLLKSTLSLSAAEMQGELGNIDQLKLTSPIMENIDSLYQHNQQQTLSADMEISAVRSLGQGYTLEPSLHIIADQNTNFRMQGTGPSDAYEQIDSLTTRFRRNAMQYSVELSLQKHKENEYWTLTLSGDAVQMHPVGEGIKSLKSQSFFYLFPSIYWQKDFSHGQHLSVTYQTNISLPDALQMIPVADY